VGVPTDRRYLKSHEWHKLDGNICTIGITQFAADELTDITYVSLPKVGKEVAAGQPMGEVESVKATSELYCGVSGVVTEVNEKLNNAPELVNSALGEVANIVASACLTALGTLTGLTMVPSTPQLSLGSVGELMVQALQHTKKDGGLVVMLEARFQTTVAPTVEGWFFVLPDPPSLSKLLRTLGV
jgi:glycine cleavage system H protein